MLIEQAENILWKHFHPKSSIVLVTGKWGVGKSHLIRQFTEKLEPNSVLRVSAFNTSTQSEFRSKIGISYLLRFADEGRAKRLIRVIGSAISRIVRMRSIIDLTSDKLSEYAYYTISNKVIWLDDLERHPNIDSAITILGEIVDLVENQNCKAIIACSIDKIQDNEGLRVALEKVCTSQFEFDRNYQELIVVGLGDYAKIPVCIDLVKKLDIKNIRILERIRRALNVLLDLKSNRLNDDVKSQIIATTILACFVKFGDKWPRKSLEYLYKHGEFIRDDKDATKFSDFLYSLGYSNTDALDLKIISFIDKGVIDEVSYRNAAIDNDTQARESKIRKAVYELSSTLSDRFDLSKDEIFNLLYEFAKMHKAFLDIHQWNILIRKIKILKDESSLQAIVDLLPSSFKLSYHGKEERAFGKERNKFVDEIESRIEWIDEDLEKSTLKEVCNRLISNSGWWSEDDLILAETDPEVFSKFLIEEAKDNGGAIINGMIEMAEHHSGSQQKLRIGENAINILRIISKGSKGVVAASMFDERVKRLNEIIAKNTDHDK